MIEYFVLINSSLIVILIVFVVLRSVFTGQSIFGQTPIPLFFFILAKFLVFSGLLFLFFRGFSMFFQPSLIPLEFLGIILLSIGTIIVILTTIQLSSDLIFGLSTSKQHKLKTGGIYRFSRHPFYLGFILILFSSCILHPHFLNIISFTGAWIIHHFIMIKEEEHLLSMYGNEYLNYKNKVSRYLTLF